MPCPRPLRGTRERPWSPGHKVPPKLPPVRSLQTPVPPAAENQAWLSMWGTQVLSRPCPAVWLSLTSLAAKGEKCASLSLPRIGKTNKAMAERPLSTSGADFGHSPEYRRPCPASHPAGTQPATQARQPPTCRAPQPTVFAFSHLGPEPRDPTGPAHRA